MEKFPYKFLLFDKVKHVKTGDVYLISKEPRPNHLLEHCNEPYYEYLLLSDDKIKWVLRQSEMEDGRFIKYEE